MAQNFTNGGEPEGNESVYGQKDYDPNDPKRDKWFRNYTSFGGYEGGANDYANRAQQMGSGAQQRGAYQSDFTQSDESRGYGMGALGLLQAQAEGRAPSAAEVLARRNQEAAIQATNSSARGIKGGAGARVAAMRGAQQVGAQQLAQGNQQAEQLRAQEQARATGQLIQGSIGMRGGDLDAQRIQQQNELTQRQLNDQQQRFFEQQGFNAQANQLNANLHQNDTANQAWQGGRADTRASDQQDWDRTKDILGIASSAGQGAAGAVGSITSDPRAKEDITPVAGAAPPTFDVLAPGGGMNVLGSLEAHSKYGTRFINNPGATGMTSDVGSKLIMSPREAKYDVHAMGGGADERALQEGYIGDAPGGEERALQEEYVGQNTPSNGPRAYAPRRNAGINPQASESTPPGGYGPSQSLTAQPRDLDEAMRDAVGRTPEAGGEYPHLDTMTPQETRAGYAKRRAGKPGYMFGPAPEADASVPGVTDYHRTEQAPGTDDWERYGKGAKKSDEIDWNKGGAVKGAKSDGGFLGALAKGFGGIAESSGSGMRSDERAKADAWDEGHRAAIDNIRKLAGRSPDDLRKIEGEMPDAVEALKLARATSAPPPSKAPAVKASAKNAAAAAESAGEKYDPDRKPFVIGVPPAAPDLGAAAFGPPPPDPRSAMRSDRSTKLTAEDIEQMSPQERADNRDAIRRVRGRAKRVTGDIIGQEAGKEEETESPARAFLSRLTSDERAKVVEKSQEPMANALRAMEPSAYRYKPQYTPPDQKEGEINVGPMANDMARDPVARVAIERGPDGLLMIDRDKALKLTMGGLSSLQNQLDDVRRFIDEKTGRRASGNPNSKPYVDPDGWDMPSPDPEDEWRVHDDDDVLVRGGSKSKRSRVA